jgi:hypothetical protein
MSATLSIRQPGPSGPRPTCALLDAWHNRGRYSRLHTHRLPTWVSTPSPYKSNSIKPLLSSDKGHLCV